MNTGTHSLTLDGNAVGHGLPPRQIPLDELREILLQPSTAFETRDAALRLLVRRAQDDHDVAMVGLIGMLLPGLRKAAKSLVSSSFHQWEDLQAEMLTGFLTAVDALDPDRDRIAARLLGSAKRAGHQLLRRASVEHQMWSLQRPVRGASAGHPDLVLMRAAKEGAIQAKDAEIIGETRLQRTSLRSLARRWGCTDGALGKRRQRAEPSLVTWLIKEGACASARPARGRLVTKRYLRDVPVLSRRWSSS